MPSVDVAAEFLRTLNGLHPSLTFTMELPVDNKIPFIGIEIVKNGTKLETQVYRKPTNTGLLLHFQSHTDKRYKDSLLQTMIHHLRPKEIKPSIVNKQCVVYNFSCDLCDADYVGYTARHLHQRIAKHKNSAIGRHFLEAHGNNNLLRESQFTVLRKCQSKFDCLVFEMLFIKKLKLNLNIQTDSIRAKPFV
ncbi:uncharacterized protein LOC113682528 [Pocillopora damicornis]|uniref:uncharacterized protein LOC113682528 n=1 Tax=Pocillopora damicornis TaxID=46731 RepID=UPI000F54F887|nr:uncharacterized protein LOC113682528 [Pocillopora damicornis]